MNDLHFEAAWYPREDDAEREPALFETHSRTWYFLREGATTEEAQRRAIERERGVFYFVGIIKKSEKTAVLVIRTHKDTLPPNLTWYFGMFFKDQTPTDRVTRTSWLNDINYSYSQAFTRLIVDSE